MKNKNYIIIKNKKHYFDNKFYFELKKYDWYENQFGYAYTHVNGKLISMYRLIFLLINRNPDINYYEIHHINDKKNDNRLSNLKVLTKSDHSKTKKHFINKKSKFWYVSFTRRKNKFLWTSIISYVDKNTKKRKSIYCGKFENEIDAAKASDKFIENNQNLFLTRKRTNKELLLY
jgi:hypothetical protein